MDVFWKHRFVLRCLGVPLPGEVKTQLGVYFFWFYFLIVVGFQVGPIYLYFRGAYLYMYTDLINRIVSVASAISSIAALVKLFIIRRHGKILKELMDDLSWFHADTERGILVDRVMSFYQWSTFSILVTFHWQLGTDRKRHLPYWTEYAEGGPWVRDYLIWAFYGVCDLSCNVIVDSLFLLIASQICHKLYVLGNTLNSFSRHPNPDLGPTMQFEGEVSDKEKIVACVKEHIHLLKSIRTLEWFFDEIIIFQILYSFSTLCVSLFASSQAEDPINDMIKLSTMLSSLAVELFIYCWGGEMVKAHCEDLHFATYNSGWYDCPLATKKSLKFIQQFSSETVSMKSAKVFELSLQTYETVVRETISYYTVMVTLFS